MSPPVVVAEGLGRAFQVQQRRRGLAGAVVDLFDPRRRTLHAVSDLDLTVHRGEVVGLLGANGAGKSTTVKCLTGLLQPTTGRVRVAGLRPWAERQALVRRMGVVFGQRSQLWWDLAVQEAFDLLAALHDIPPDRAARRVAELDDLLDLGPLRSQPVRELSLGQRMRCDLAASLLHDPDVLVLDEPTIGLDVSVKAAVRRFVAAAADRGVAVLLTTHDLGDVEALCHRVVLLDGGRGVFDGDLAALRRTLGTDRRVTLTADPVHHAALAAAGEGAGARVVRTQGPTLVLQVGPDDVAGVTEAVVGAAPVRDLAVAPVPLEELVAAWYERRP